MRKETEEEEIKEEKKKEEDSVRESLDESKS